MCTIMKNEQFNSFEITFDGKPSEAVRDLLKANGYRWHGVKRVWYGYNDITEQLNGAEAMSDSTATEQAEQAKQKAEQKADKEKQAELLNQYMASYEKRYTNESEKYLQWMRSEIARIIELDDGGLLTIEKPKIKTNFCFGYGYCGMSTEEEREFAESTRDYAKSHSDYFIHENLKQLTETTDLINEYLNSEKPNYIGTIPLSPYVVDRFGDGKTKDLHFMDSWRFENLATETKKLYRKATTAELQRILTAYEIEIKTFEKRLQAYLKRYGLSKLHTWTYLSD